ncbi:MAG: hypothetical protein M4579_006087 [Chaenotheca gracillima]|nr:MAG: hypothetical protein M4579_006087 [Chaenotheca gracillima]
MTERATLVRPPPIDPSKAVIENVLELTSLGDIGPDIFTNTRPLWHPPGARGIFGGAVIAQCLSAAQNTVPENFTVHSMHCYFVLAGDSEIPILYHVERVREGKSFATRTVQARQRGKCVFTTTLSFVREGSGGKRLLQHAVPMPEVQGPFDDVGDMSMGDRADRPFESQRIDILNDDSPRAYEKKTRQWVKANGNISPKGGHQAHLSALAYMSDSYFVGTISRVHKIWRIPTFKEVRDRGEKEEDVFKKIREADGMRGDSPQDRPQIGMMVSLDHTIYFHDPRAFRADEWMFTEMETPWTDDGRGLVLQRIFTRDGRLIASCVQEGLVRLKQDEDYSSSHKSKL